MQIFFYTNYDYIVFLTKFRQEQGYVLNEFLNSISDLETSINRIKWNTIQINYLINTFNSIRKNRLIAAVLLKSITVRMEHIVQPLNDQFYDWFMVASQRLSRKAFIMPSEQIKQNRLWELLSSYPILVVTESLQYGGIIWQQRKKSTVFLVKWFALT